MEDATVQAVSAEQVLTVSASAKVSSRHYFATRHLWMARHSARLCQERESALVSANQVNGDIEHSSLAVTAVLSSVAFLEALVNEVFLDVVDTPLGQENRRNDGITDDAADLMRNLWEDRASILDKYQLALVCARKPKFETGGTLYQKVNLLIKLRNELVHFKPEWQDHSELHRLQKKLQGEFPGNQQPIGDPWYPNKCFGAGCAKWAHTVSTEFTNEWVRRIGLTRNYLEDFDSFPTP